MSWFEQLFGFREGAYGWTQQQFHVAGDELVSKANGRTFPIGVFSTPSVSELRARASGLVRGTLTLRHEAVPDILELHAHPDNAGAVFQAASQFNCLEFAGSEEVPEDGVTQYENDPTQGPACALAAAAGTVYRNYFVEVDGARGQTSDRQINTLRGVQTKLGACGQLVVVRNGYTFSDAQRLVHLNQVLVDFPRDDLVGEVRVGLHSGVGVTFSQRFVPMDPPHRVSQVYCSALSCGYSAGGLDNWGPLATIVLDGAYEATLLAAAAQKASGVGTGRVWLTFLGGGVFGNKDAWIADAIGRAAALMMGWDLDVRVAHHRRVDPTRAALVDVAVTKHLAGPPTTSEGR